MSCSFTRLFKENHEWQRKIFGQSGPQAKLDRLFLEFYELYERPEEDEEYADCMLLLVGAWTERGKTPQELLEACRRKLEINKKRKWRKSDEQSVAEQNHEEGGAVVGEDSPEVKP